MEIDGIKALATKIREEVGKAVIGQDDTVDLMLTALFSAGHILLEGPPGTAKTLLTQCFAAAIKLDFGRIQFTPDLMPGDVIGTNLFNFSTNEFTLTKGPIFTDILLADEINRTPPKTQAALLEAMQERKVTIDGEAHRLNPHFTVIATQNPIEQQGTYPLPEAQLDRFLVQIVVGYPDRDTERDILLATTGTEEAEASQVFDVQTLIKAQDLLRRMPVGESVMEAILDLVRAFRPENPEASADVREHVAWGPGPRAAQALMLTVRARAMLQGRLAPSVEDVAAMASAVLGHRMALSFTARARGISLDDLIDDVTRKTTMVGAAA